MNVPRLSVVTPSYNQAEFIKDTIVSAKSQNYPDLEHIVVDGGSTDETIDILREHESDYDLRWVSEEDRGQTHAINKGIEMATGEWIGWLNADDYYLSGATDALLTGLERNPEPQLVYGDLVFVDRDRNELFRRYHTRPSKFIHRYWTLFTANHCTFFRADLFDTVGKLDGSATYTMDAEFLWRVLDAGVSCIHVPTLIGARRMHEATKTGEDPGAVQAELSETVGSDASFLPEPLLRASATALKLSYIIGEGLHPETLAEPRWSTKALYYELSRAFSI